MIAAVDPDMSSAFGAGAARGRAQEAHRAAVRQPSEAAEPGEWECCGAGDANGPSRRGRGGPERRREY